MYGDASCELSKFIETLVLSVVFPEGEKTQNLGD